MLESALLLARCALFAAAVVSDLTGRWIPDGIPLTLLLLFVVYTLAIGHRAAVWTHIAVGTVLLLIGFGLFVFGGLGGGDGKLMAVAGLWVGPHELTLFLISLGLLSLSLALFALLPFAHPPAARQPALCGRHCPPGDCAPGRACPARLTE